MKVRNELNKLLKQLIERPYEDTYKVGLQFFFNLRHLERLAEQYCIADNRSPEEDGIYRHGGYNTVPDLNFLELETYLWEKIKPTVEKNKITFISTCMALTYEPTYHKVNMHLHRESLRKINPSVYNYTFFLCDTDNSTVNFNVVDKPVHREDIFKYNLIDYVSVDALREYIKEMPTITYNLSHGDVMRFDATKVVHGASNNFIANEIGLYLVLNGCADKLSYKEHQVFRKCFE
jgi:hypothetical protein